MSAIYGYIRNANIRKEKPSLKGLGEWQQSYGTSGFSEISDETFLLGCYLEKFTEDAVKSEPVMCRGEKVWAVDALLYDRKRMYDILGAGDFSALSDEELLATFIEKNGFTSLKDVNGDFAGAVYDRTDNSVVFFRDHMGVRTLYYYVSDDCICFATDIRGLCTVNEVDIYPSAEWIFNAYFGCIDYNSVSTEFEKIYCVRPASVLSVSFSKEAVSKHYTSRLLNSKKYDYEVNDRQRIYWKSLKHINISEEKYWYLGEKKIRFKTEKEYCDKFRELIIDAVQRRMDVFPGKIGAEFSGGLDSSLISILVKRLGRDGIYCSWSIDPKDLPLQDKDERKIIEEICRNEGISCKYLTKTVDFGKDSLFKDNYSKLTDVETDRPWPEKYLFWPMINTYELFASADYVKKNGGSVVFTGHGGDEGVSHRPNIYELFRHHEYKNFFANFEEMSHGRLKKLKAVRKGIRKIVRVKKYLKENRESARAKMENQGVWEFLNPEFIKTQMKNKQIPLSFMYDPRKFVIRGGDRVRMDNVAMYGGFSGVRYVLPYLDYRVIDFAISIERGMHLRHCRTRYIFKEAFKDMLPDALLGDVDKSDPSFGGNFVKDIPFEDKVNEVVTKIKTYNALYGDLIPSEFYPIKDILRQIDEKTVTKDNFGELCVKFAAFSYMIRLVVIADKLHGGEW